MRGAALIVVAIVVVLVLSASETKAGRSACAAAGSRTLVSTAQARIYRDRDYRAVACSYREGRHVVLDTSFGRSFAPYAVNAHYVASLRRYYEGAATYFDLVEQSLGTGRERFEEQNGPSDDCGGEDDCGAASVGRIVMRRDGSVAWVACYSYAERCTSGPYAVLLRDRIGVRLLDRGAHIRPRSLTISGRRVSWQKRGLTRRATIR